MSTGSSVYYNGYGSYDFQKIFLRIKPLKEVEKNILKKCSSREFDNKKNEHRITWYYDGYGSYYCPKNFLQIKPLLGVKKKEIRKMLI